MPTEAQVLDALRPVEDPEIRQSIVELDMVRGIAVHGDRVAVAAKDTPEGVEIWVDDDGPGIDPEHFEEAFAPFVRLDDARNQNETGVGLGLAIAREVARGHGGEVTLERSALGGLRATMRLPLAEAGR